MGFARQICLLYTWFVASAQVPEWIYGRCDDKYRVYSRRAFGPWMISAVNEELLQLIKFMPRDKHYADIFCGAAGIHKELQTRGLKGNAFDRRTKDASEDICKRPGLLYMAHMCVDVMPGGIVNFAPQCSTWGNMAIGHTKRGRDPDSIEGDTSRLDVREGNFTAEILSWLIQILAVLGIWVVVENPLGSMLYHMQCMSKAIANLSLQRVVTCLGAFGAASEKPLEIYTNVPNHSYIKRTKEEAHKKWHTAQTNQ